MGKRLLASVTFSDTETGETRTVTPNDKLSAADRKALEKNWGKRIGEIMADDPDVEDEVPDGPPMEQQEDAQAALDAGHPHEDTAMPLQDKNPPGVESAVEKNQQVRTDANPAGVEDSKSGSKTRRNVGG